MTQVNVHDAKSQLSKLLEMVENGETVIIARNGHPVVELIPARKRVGLPFGIAKDHKLVPDGDAWWAPLNDDEAAAWTDGE